MVPIEDSWHHFAVCMERTGNLDRFQTPNAVFCKSMVIKVFNTHYNYLAALTHPARPFVRPDFTV